MAKRKPVKRAAKRSVEYYPPAAEDVSRYTDTVCQVLGEKVDPYFNSAEARDDLEGFLKVVGTIWSKHLNKQRR